LEQRLVFRLLGPLEVERDGTPVVIAAARERALLALLLLRRGEVVPAEQLAEELWAGRPPAGSRNTLQGYVAGLRRALGREAIETTSSGYRLRPSEWTIDIDAFETAARLASGELAEQRYIDAAQTYAEALALWRGAPLTDVRYERFAQAEAARLDELRLVCEEGRLEAELGVGRAADLIPDLERLARAEPLRERRHRQLMLALYRAGRQADALAVYHDFRGALVDELGLDPTPQLQQLERQILAHAPELDAVPASPRALPEGTVTLVFTDVEGSTHLLQRLGAAAYSDVLERHRALLRQAFLARGGREVDSEGDGTFTAFTRAGAAVEAAGAAQAALSAEPWPDGAAVRVRIGVHTGEPLVAGSRYVGLDVHRAARIMSAAHGGQVLVSQTTHDLLDGQTALRDLGPYRLRDLLEPVRLYQLETGGHVAYFPPPRTLEYAAPDPLAAARALRADLLADAAERPFVGRERERDRLRLHWRAAAAGRSRIVLVAGEPGIGKTQLALRFALDVESDGGWVAIGRTDDDSPVSFQPFVEALRQLLVPEVVECLEASVVADIARLVPELGAEARRARDRDYLFDSVLRTIVEAAAIRPVLLVLDDVQWADESTLLLLRHVARLLRRQPVLLLVLYRLGDAGAGTPLARAFVQMRRDHDIDRISLGGLGLDETTELAGDVVGADPVEQLHSRTGGNPFFIREFVRSRSEGSVAELPEGVQELVRERVGRLGSDAARALAIAAVAGREFDLDVLEDVVGGCVPAVELVERAVSARLVMELPGHVERFAFAHDLVRDALLSGRTAAGRVRVHLRIAESLERMRGRRAVDVGELAFHFYEARHLGAAARAVEYAREAATVAVSRLAYEDAVTWYERALGAAHIARAEAAERFELLLALGTALDAAGRFFPRAREVLADAAAVARGLGSPPALGRAALAFTTWQQLGEADAEGIALLEEALARLGDDEPPLRVRLLSRLAVRCHPLTDQPRREHLLEQAVNLARSCGDELVEPLSASMYVLRGPARLEQRLVATTELLQLLGPGGGDATELWARLARFVDYLTLADVCAADRELDELARVAERLQLTALDWYPPMLRGLRAAFAGELADARALVDEALRIQTLHDEPSEAFVAQNAMLARLSGASGDGIIEVLTEVAERHSRWVEWRAMLAVLHLDAGDLDAASAHLAAGVEAALDLVGARPNRLTALALFGEAAAAVGDASAAKRFYEALLPYGGWNVVMDNAWGCHGPVARYLGLLADALGRPRKAAEHFERAIAESLRMGARPWVATVALDYSGSASAQAHSAERRTELLRIGVAAAGGARMAGTAARLTEQIQRAMASP
jgi:DNA-binding SARP family transcriptional activator